jgi:hypothetical protein
MYGFTQISIGCIGFTQKQRMGRICGLIDLMDKYDDSPSLLKKTYHFIVTEGEA